MDVKDSSWNHQNFIFKSVLKFFRQNCLHIVHTAIIHAGAHIIVQQVNIKDWKKIQTHFSNFVPCDFWPSCRAAEIRSWPPVNKQMTALPKLNHKLFFIKVCKSVLVTVYHSPSLYKQVLLKASKGEELAAMLFSWAEWYMKNGGEKSCSVSSSRMPPLLDHYCSIYVPKGANSSRSRLLNAITT